MDSVRSKHNVTAAVFGAIALAVVGAFIWAWGAEFGHIVWSLVRSSLLAIVVAVALAGAAFAVTHRSESRWMVAGGLAIAGFVITAIFTSGYVVPHQLAQQTQEQAADDLDFRQRVPFDVASAVSTRNLGDTTGDATGSIKAIPAEGEYGVYTTSVERRGFFKGYESTQSLTAPLYGSTSSKNVEFCSFSEDANLKLSGWVPSNSMVRAIMWKTSPSTRVDKGDALVRCEEGTPMVYVPLTKLDGNLFFPQRVPGGVAVYNGETGELKIEQELDTDLPLYPKSVAENQREALSRSGSVFDWMFKRAGYEDTSKDEEDPNGENRAEFGLASTDGNTQFYVTPLTSRGSSSSIIALGTIESDGKVKSGELHPYVVHKYESGESRQANSAIASRITGEVLSGYMASGLKVFEVVPSEDGTWTATVGKEQSVLYRAVIHPDGTIDLLDANGKPVAGDGKSSEEGEPDLDAGKPIEEMTTEELKQLGDQVLEELATRADSE